jgi:hypothetical protein
MKIDRPKDTSSPPRLVSLALLTTKRQTRAKSDSLNTHSLSIYLLAFHPAEVGPVGVCHGPHHPVVQLAAPALLVRHLVDQGEPVRGQPLLHTQVDGYTNDDFTIYCMYILMPRAVAHLEVPHVGAERARGRRVAGVALALFV